MTVRACFALLLFFIVLLSLASCSFNPFTTENKLTGSPTATVTGGVIGAGSAAILGAPRSIIALAGLGGATVGYYVSTLNFAAGGVNQVGGQVYTLGDYVTIEIPTDKIFEDNSAELLPEAKPILQSAVAVLQYYPENNIIVSSNTSGFGTRKFELALSEARAQRVAAFLWANGINSLKTTNYEKPLRKLIYVGYGDYFPIANNIRASGIRANSRIQITAFPSKYQLQLTKHQKVFANIGGLQEPPLRQKSTYNVDNAFKGDLLPEAPTTISRGFSESTSYRTAPIQKERSYYAERPRFKGEETWQNQNNIAREAQTSRGVSAAKQGGFRSYSYKDDGGFK